MQVSQYSVTELHNDDKIKTMLNCEAWYLPIFEVQDTLVNLVYAWVNTECNK